MLSIELDFDAERIAREKENQALFTKLVGQFSPAPALGVNPAPDGSKNTIVAVRVRPRLDMEIACDEPQAVFARTGESGVVDAHQLRRSVRNRPPTLQASLLSLSYYTQTTPSGGFEIDRVYNEKTHTEDIYNDIVKPLVPWALNGGTATLFAHGQTGSGKTYVTKSLQYLVAEEIFKDDSYHKCRVVMSIIELAGNSAYDLLNSSNPVPILQDCFGNTQLRGVLEVAITSHSSMIEYLDKASALRRVSATDKNNASSRSHAICRIRIDRAPGQERGDLYLIDLAGSEAARDSVAHGALRLKETREINASLSVLNVCIRSKADADTSTKKKSRVPFRQSALTRVLKHIFDPASSKACKMVVLACVNPCFGDVGPSKNTLRYAGTCRAMVAKHKSQVYDAKKPVTWSNAQLKAWIKSNSGIPAVDADVLAPFESGAQLLRLSISQFVDRCLMTPGVTPQQAGAFQSKLWLMHVDANDSRHKKKNNNNKTLENPSSSSSLEEVSGNESGISQEVSSQEPSQLLRCLDFKQRIRPGMAVQWDASQFPLAQPGMNIAVVLSDERGTRYLCALMTPIHTMVNSGYDLQLWKQVVVNVCDMMGEVIMVYDAEARHYFIQV
ncbi:P-loop containing nucleoside triphosphate hydrolase protein [Mariannaea sp. PMI_226]|nr:P-loop containing nucleoside triphosphate hydrolase protein [Mariannaea sp. PMI_226]